MSAKSRKRNRRLAALAGVITAGTLAARKNKADLASTEDGKSANTTIQDNKPKKDTAKKETPTVKTKKTIQDNKYDPKKGKFGTITQKDETGQNITKKITPFKDSGLTLGVSKRKRNMDTYKGYATKTGNSRGDLGTTGRPEKKDYFGATMLPKSQAADNFKADNREYGRANEYKSGGRVKGCGKALRGFGKAMKGSR
jgi:hypothetical protein